MSVREFYVSVKRKKKMLHSTWVYHGCGMLAYFPQYSEADPLLLSVKGGN